MPDASQDGLRNVSVTTSEICWIDGDKGILIYRGFDIHDLAQHSSFEETAWLLWHGKLPTKAELAALNDDLSRQREVPAKVIDLLRSMPATQPEMSKLRTAVSYLESFDPDAGDDSPEARIRMARRLTAQFPTVVAAISRIRQGKEPVKPDPKLSLAANFLYMLNGERPDETSARTMDMCLVLHAEHGFNASTFTGRVVAATLSDMYSAVTAAIGALKGPLHGGANTAVIKMLLDIGSSDKVDAWVAARLAKKEKIMGMGHAVYKTFDPRAVELEQLARQMGERIGNTKWLDMSKQIYETVHAQKGLYPNVDFFSASTYYTMGLDPEIYTLIFATSRITGWTAHIIEQLTHNKLIRPRCDYTGPKDLTYVPMEER